MSDLFEQGQALFNKLEKTLAKGSLTQKDWEEPVRLLLAAAEQRTGLTTIQYADCYNWAGGIMLNHYEDRSPEMYNEIMRVLMKMETIPGLPNWFCVFDNQFVARISPMTYGFDPSQVDTGDDALISGLAERMVRYKGSVETANSLPALLQRSIFKPVYSGQATSFSENRAAIVAIDKMIQMVWNSLAHVPVGENGITCNGLLHHYCKPKTRENFDTAIASYKAAIAKPSPRGGEPNAYAHLIDLLERPEFHGFGDVVDKEAALAEAANVRAQREAWYRRDPSRHTMLWEIVITVFVEDDDFFNIYKPTLEMQQHALKLGDIIFAESNSNSVKLHVARLLGYIYHRHMLATKENLQKALEYYRCAFEQDPGADGSLKTKVGSFYQTEQYCIDFNTSVAKSNLQKVLNQVLPLCFFPEQSLYEELPSDELSEFQDFLSHFAETHPEHVLAESVDLCVKEYKAYADRVKSMMATKNPGVKNDVMVQSLVEEVGVSIVENSGNSEKQEENNEKEEKLKTTIETVSSFLSDETMTTFHKGFSRTFYDIYKTSSGKSHNAAKLATSAASMVLSVVPIINSIGPIAMLMEYNEMTKRKLKSNAKSMIDFFPDSSSMIEAVMKVLREVHGNLHVELNDLEKNASRIMHNIIDKLSEQMKALIGKESDEKKDFEKLASQVAMMVIEKVIYATKNTSRCTNKPQLLFDETNRTVVEMRAKCAPEPTAPIS